MAGFESPATDALAAVSRGTTEAADVFATGPLDTLKEAYHHGTEFLGYQTTEAEGTVIGILEQGQLAESADRSDSRPADRADPRSHALLRRGRRPGRRHRHDPRRRLRVPGRGHQARTTTSSSTSAGSREGTVTLNARVDGRGRRRPPAGDPPGPLGDPPAAPRPAPAPGQARPAGRQQGRARPAPVRLRQPRGRRHASGSRRSRRPSTRW